MHAKNSNQRRHGMTLLESLVVMVLLAVLVAMLAPAFAPARHHGGPFCINNLKQIGTAFQIWANDHADVYPWETSTNSGGSREYAFGPDVFRHFQIMQNEMGQFPKILLCPKDKERFAATNFINFDNSNLSYFAGITVSAANTNTSLFLSGDRNITNETGVSRGLLRLTTNDVAGWAVGIHGGENPSGNILFSDGSAQQMSTPWLRQALQKPGVAPTVVAVP
jgi:prepilin-type N-terminal cleavage/methylation domain-containing protein